MSTTQLVVVMVEGSLEQVAQREQWLEIYKYQQNASNPERFDLLSSSPEDDGAALLISEDGERIEIISESSTNVTQACYIAARFGWTSCRIVEAHSQEVYRNFVERLNIEMVEPTDEVVCLDAHEPAALNVDQLAPFSAPTFELEDGKDTHEPMLNNQDAPLVEVPLVFDLPTDEIVHATAVDAAMRNVEKTTLHEIEALTARANDAEMNVDRLEDALLESQTEIQRLRQQLHEQQRNGSVAINYGGSQGITKILEGHVADLVRESAVKSLSLIKELEANGFNVAISVALTPAPVVQH